MAEAAPLDSSLECFNVRVQQWKSQNEFSLDDRYPCVVIDTSHAVHHDLCPSSSRIGKYSIFLPLSEARNHVVLKAVALEQICRALWKRMSQILADASCFMTNGRRILSINEAYHSSRQGDRLIYDSLGWTRATQKSQSIRPDQTDQPLWLRRVN